MIVTGHNQAIEVLIEKFPEIMAQKPEGILLSDCLFLWAFLYYLDEPYMALVYLHLGMLLSGCFNSEHNTLIDLD
jgi:hypothetical protein